MAAVLKVTFRAEVRRCLLDKQDLCYEGLTRRVDELYPELPQYTAKYMDEEGDVCTLCEASFADFLEVSSQAKSATANNLGSDTKVILKLELEVPGVSKVSSKPPTAVPPAVPEEPDLEIISGPAPMTVQEVNVPITPAPTASVFVDKAPESPRPAAAPASDVPADEDMGQQEKPEDLPKQEHAASEEAPSTLREILSPTVLASVVVCHMPQAMAVVGEREPSEIGQRVCDVLAHAPPLKEALKDLRERLPEAGLEHVVPALDAFFAEETPETAGQLALSLITGLDLLPFEDQIKLLTEFFASRRSELVQGVEGKVPCGMLGGFLTHQAICDGCGVEPMRGPRFKCTSCPNYDLCGNCYARKREIHGAECAVHDFDCILSGLFPVSLGSMMSGQPWNPQSFRNWGKGASKGNMGGMPGLVQGLLSGLGKGGASEASGEAPNPLGGLANFLGGLAGKGGAGGAENPLAGLAGLFGKGGAQSPSGCSSNGAENPLAGLAGLFGKGGCQSPGGSEGHGAENPWAGLAGLFGKGGAQNGCNRDGGHEPCNPWANLAGFFAGKGKGKGHPFAGMGKGCHANPAGTSAPPSTTQTGYEQPAASAPTPSPDEPSAPPSDTVDQKMEIEANSVEEPSTPPPASLKVEEKKLLDVKEEPENIRYSFPVQVDDGRNLQLSWTKADDRELVAREFLGRYHLPGDQVNQIVAFMNHAESISAPSCAASSTPASSAAACIAASSWEQAPGMEAAPTYDEQIAQLQDQGFTVDVEELRSLLTAFGGSMERVVEALVQ